MIFGSLYWFGLVWRSWSPKPSGRCPQEGTRSDSEPTKLNTTTGDEAKRKEVTDEQRNTVVQHWTGYIRSHRQHPHAEVAIV